MSTPKPPATAFDQLVAAMPAAAPGLVRSGPPTDLAAIYAQADRAALAAPAALRLELRNAGYLLRRPAEYSTADCASLPPQQDPGGQVSGGLPSDRPTLLLWGPSWHGKSTAAYAIGNDAARRGIWVETWFVPELADLLGPTPRHLWDDT